MKRLSISLLFLCAIPSVLIISLSQSCRHEPDNINDLPTVCFDNQIKPILSTCAKCHGANSGEEGFDPTSYNSIMQSVKPGDPWGSELYTIISEPNNPDMMPPKGNTPLSADQRMLIEVWILQGAKETKCDTSTVKSALQTEEAFQLANINH